MNIKKELNGEVMDFKNKLKNKKLNEFECSWREIRVYNRRIILPVV